MGKLSVTGGIIKWGGGRFGWVGYIINEKGRVGEKNGGGGGTWKRGLGRLREGEQYPGVGIIKKKKGRVIGLGLGVGYWIGGCWVVFGFGLWFI